MSFKEVIFKTNNVEEFLEYFSRVKFPELQIIVKMLFENDATIKFEGFESHEETDNHNNELISYKVEFLDEKRSLSPKMNIRGVQKKNNNEGLNIVVDYFSIDYSKVTGYILLQDGKISFENLAKISWFQKM